MLCVPPCTPSGPGTTWTRAAVRGGVAASHCTRSSSLATGLDRTADLSAAGESIRSGLREAAPCMPT
eukprot:4059942-Pyramimonas_sp.AAC.1